MARCRLCNHENPLVSARLGFCGPCIKRHFEEVWPEIQQVHFASRQAFGLPVAPPRHPEGRLCNLCFHQCLIPPWGSGYCGARRREGDRLVGGTAANAGVSWYDDHLPTNCVASWFCPASTGAGYPNFTRQLGPEHGWLNLAVFYHGCNFNCLYCQNWEFKVRGRESFWHPALAVADAVGSRTACLCFFGGDPTPHLPHALTAARLAQQAAKTQGRRLRICWETNGSMTTNWLPHLLQTSLPSGGVIKFDLKAWSREIHLALTGVDNRQVLENFAILAESVGERPEVPLLTASTLLVPGYIDLEEIAGLANFIARLDKNIPYSLLAFYPCFYLTDLPRTPRQLAQDALAVAQAAGLRQVRLGNEHLLNT